MTKKKEVPTTMKAVLIDAKNKTVTDVDVPKIGTLNAWYDLLNCRTVEVACYLNNTDSILVDEEGLLGELTPDTPCFTYEGAPQPYVGSGLITGVKSSSGASISAKLTAADVKGKIKFLSLSDVHRDLKG